jgi:hypothetical protein
MAVEGSLNFRDYINQSDLCTKKEIHLSLRRRRKVFRPHPQQKGFLDISLDDSFAFENA